ncbi:uncharacterized protein C1orf50 homolog isoform X2 [Daphnia pulex]|uniref:uncharacterized protein C1orf50 homolog isoform X2 n=1 Tax=Daphnia pulex TaxID=6669 RepID=UPI001EE08563|nr:uncharacterized protein C1orf50 homolog isoform X2 [Daphnia pulex]XP_046652620.1 uncharacterized protein C1orf50 homolog isoform X2 [Daphnia pulicaria]
MEHFKNTSVALVERPSSADLGVQLVDSERSGRKTQSDLVELATQIQTADAFTRSNVCNKLQVIADQVRFLHEQARRILEETKEAENLHHFACNFKKVPGKVYYLYQRTSGQKYFAMLSPEEWGANCPHTFLGGYRLEADMSWTPTSKVEKKDNELRLINQILDGNKSVSAAIDMDRKIPQGQITFN